MPKTPTKPTTPPGGRTVDDGDFSEESAVFTRTATSPETPAPQSSERAPSSADRAERIDAKIRQAHAVIATLRPEDLRARLLHIAVVRRDEVLLTGVLRSLHVDEDSAVRGQRERTTILPPPDRKR